MKNITNDEERKLFFFTQGYIFIAVVSLFFIISDTIKKDFTEMSFGTTALALLTLLFVRRKNIKNRQIIYDATIWLLALAMLILVYMGVGGTYTPFWTLILPVFSAALLGIKLGMITISIHLIPLCLLLSNIIPGQPYRYEIEETLAFLTIYLFTASLTFSLEYSRKKALDHVMATNEELKKALDEVESLQEILPICSYCKKIRDDKGYWDQVDNYFRLHKDLVFSHGICPDCAEEHFPEIVGKEDKG